MTTGYVDCGCRDCFEIAIGEVGAFCWECREAGCEKDAECQQADAYGVEDEDDDASEET